MIVGVSFRHSAGFGKRMEYNLVGQMLMEGLDVYLPLVDDHGVDCVIKREDGTFIEIQIKARSNEVAFGDAALFAAITHELTPNFYFVFYFHDITSFSFANISKYLFVLCQYFLYILLKFINTSKLESSYFRVFYYLYFIQLIQ